MELTQSATPTPSRIHPLVAAAAVSVTLVSLLGVAALSGLLPNSQGSSEAQKAASVPAVATASLASTAASSASTPTAAAVLVQTPVGYQYMQPVYAPMAAYPQVEPQHTVPTTTHHSPRHRAQTYAQADTRLPTYQSPSRQQPSYQQPARQANSPVGIATGAVVGGLLGNQVGQGNGRTLATVAGAVGGGYLGNMAGQKYGY